MSLFGPYIHRIDPVIGSIFGFHLWWYGLSYTLGFLNIHLWLRRRHDQLGFPLRTVYDLTLLVSAGVLLGGRFVEVAFYEWPFYREHLILIPAYWIGGMATHGLLFGGVAGVWLFCRLNRRPFLEVTDALSVPAAFILGAGRLGNFIDGQIVGSLTDGWWGVKFPDAEGFRHPVVLYDGIKNLLLIPLLIQLGKKEPPRGTITGVFLFLYAFLRIFVDLFREYPTTLLGLATGQSLNIFMAVLGFVLLGFCSRTQAQTGDPASDDDPPSSAVSASSGILWRQFVFLFLLIFSLTLPSDWTQDIPARYSKRHPGLYHSALYPEIQP